ncbi:MAG: hypothetical protein LQ340_002330, partial [Diploschistes diacapsis]
MSPQLPPLPLDPTCSPLQIDPHAQVSDCHDALTFLAQHPLVDGARIALWGLSLSGAVVLAAAALDPRVAAVIALAPTARLDIAPAQRAAILQQAPDDRVARVTSDGPPAYTPMAAVADGSNLAGLPIDARPVRELQRRSPHFSNRFTVQTAYRLVHWSVVDLLPHIRCPVMVVAPELDAMAPPARQRAEVFDALGGEKRFEVMEGKGHWD